MPFVFFVANAEAGFLSSAEAEVYACSSGASDAILLARLLSWMTGRKAYIQLYTNSSGAKGILRQGVGRLRHLSCRILWLQNLILAGEVRLGSVAGTKNPADFGTKRLPASRMRSLMSLLGMYNVSSCSVEGHDDPAGILQSRSSIRAILSALSLVNLKGCEDSTVTAGRSSGFGLGLTIFTALIGLAILLLMTWLSNRQFAEPQAEPDAEPAALATDDEAGDAIPAAPVLPPEAIQAPRRQPTPEGMIIWLMERCLRRRDRQVDRTRYNMYNDRVYILEQLFQTLRFGSQTDRLAARRMLASMSDISDDENSPNHDAIRAEQTMEEAEQAQQFIERMGGSAQTHGAASLHVMRVAQRHRELADEEPEIYEDDSDAEETQSQKGRRYRSSPMEECSDPEYWADLHYGQ